jgi:hypothetical protein
MRANSPGRPSSSVGAYPVLKMARRMDVLIRRSRNPILLGLQYFCRVVLECSLLNVEYALETGRGLAVTSPAL